MRNLSKNIFTEQEIDILKQNKYVKRVGPKGITQTDKMKQLVISEIEKQMFPIEIFEKVGFDISIVAQERPRSAIIKLPKQKVV